MHLTTLSATHVAFRSTTAQWAFGEMLSATKSGAIGENLGRAAAKGKFGTKSVARAAMMLSATTVWRSLSRRSLSASAVKPIDPLRLTDVTLAELAGHLNWVKENPKAPNPVVLIDVRGPKEIAENGGSIPTAVNLPTDRLAEGLQKMGPEEFANEFRFPQPDRATDTLLFYCRLNTRSSMAAAFSRSIGYRALVYSGGWEEWKSNNK